MCRSYHPQLIRLERVLNLRFAVFVGFYGMTWAPAGWIYCSEVFPLKYRAKGVGFSAATNWM